MRNRAGIALAGFILSLAAVLVGALLFLILALCGWGLAGD